MRTQQCLRPKEYTERLMLVLQAGAAELKMENANEGICPEGCSYGFSEGETDVYIICSEDVA